MTMNILFWSLFVLTLALLAGCVIMRRSFAKSMDMDRESLARYYDERIIGGLVAEYGRDGGAFPATPGVRVMPHVILFEMPYLAESVSGEQVDIRGLAYNRAVYDALAGTLDFDLYTVTPDGQPEVFPFLTYDSQQGLLEHLKDEVVRLDERKDERMALLKRPCVPYPGLILGGFESLDKDVRPCETAVRALYSAVMGGDAALNNARINRDRRTGRLAFLYHAPGEVYTISYIHEDGASITQIDAKTLEMKTTPLAP